MALQPDRGRTSDLALLLFGVGLVIFVSRARIVWADGRKHWLLPFVLWLGLIALGAWAAWRRKSRDP